MAGFKGETPCDPISTIYYIYESRLQGVHTQIHFISRGSLGSIIADIRARILEI